MSEKSAAILTVHRASEMTPEGRKQIASWLRRQATMLIKYGEEYSSRFTGRYLYKDDDDDEIGQEDPAAADARRA